MAAGSTPQNAVLETRFGIAPELEQRVKTQAAQFHDSYRRTLEEAWELGGALRQAKNLVKHGQWIPWIEERIGLTPRSAQRLMAVHAAYPEMRQLSRLRNVSHALRVLPTASARHADEPGTSGSATGSAAASASGNVTYLHGEGATEVANSRITAAVRDLSRVAARLETVSQKADRGVAEARQEFSTLCDSFQIISSIMIEYADGCAGHDTPSARALISALETALARAHEVRDSILDQEAGNARRS